MHTCSSRGGGGHVRGGCGATGAAGGQPRRRRFAGSRPKAQLTLVLSNRRKASPGATPIISNYNTYICLYYLCIRFRNFLEP